MPEFELDREYVESVLRGERYPMYMDKRELYAWAKKLGACWLVARAVTRAKKTGRGSETFIERDYLNAVRKYMDALRAFPDSVKFSVDLRTGSVYVIVPKWVLEYLSELRLCESVEPAEPPDWFRELLSSSAGRSSSRSSADLSELPKCIQRLADEATRRDLGHLERFDLATYLLCKHAHECLSEMELPEPLKVLECAVERSVQHYRHQSDFNEKVTLYQLRHIAGLATGRQPYYPSSCDTLRQHGLDCNCSEVKRYVSACIQFYQRLLQLQKTESTQRVEG